VNQALSTVELEYNSKRVDMKSIMSLLGMAIPTQAEVTIFVEGEDEKEVLEKVIETINSTGISKL
jgi:phosphocarrier protein